MKTLSLTSCPSETSLRSLTVLLNERLQVWVGFQNNLVNVLKHYEVLLKVTYIDTHPYTCIVFSCQVFTFSEPLIFYCFKLFWRDKSFAGFNKIRTLQGKAEFQRLEFQKYSQVKRKLWWVSNHKGRLRRDKVCLRGFPCLNKTLALWTKTCCQLYCSNSQISEILLGHFIKSGSIQMLPVIYFSSPLMLHTQHPLSSEPRAF